MADVPELPETRSKALESGLYATPVGDDGAEPPAGGGIVTPED
jgi:hypothetical protein